MSHMGPARVTEPRGAAAGGLRLPRHARRGDRTVDARIARPGYRHDIEGLRSLAVLLVVVYHVWTDRVSGGVDVFLMLSAFFLTGSFARKITAGRPLGLGAYWVKTFKRLLPVAAVVLLAVLLLARFALPTSQLQPIWRQTWASLLYVQNWELMRSSVDYYARDDALISPLQHFWSLSVQGQVFILWPLLLASTAFFVRRHRSRTRAVLTGLFLVVLVGSLAWSVYETSVRQQVAYFDTTARLWEFALGSLVALLLPSIRMPRAIGEVLTWAGLVGMVTCGLVIDVAGGFPGYFALWPTLCASAVVVGGSTGGSAARLLAWRPLRALGSSAYGLYLVHWPLLVTWRSVTGDTHASFLAGLCIIVCSIVLAYLLTRFVETPVRSWQWGAASSLRGLALVATCVALVAAPLAGWQVAEARRAAKIEAEASRDNPGARALERGYNFEANPGAPTLPLPSRVDREWVVLDEPCAGALKPSRADIAEACTQRSGVDRPARTILAVGNSHTQQQLGALLPLAEENSWQVAAILRGACPFGPRAGDAGCRAWNETVLDEILRIRPDAVFTIATAAKADAADEQLVPGIAEYVRQLHEAGIQVIAVRDNPRFTDNMLNCTLSRGVEACSRPLSDVLAPSNPAAALAPLGAEIIDLTDRTCPDEMCSTVVGNVYVYLDDNHLTWTYAESLAPALEARLAWR